MTSPVRPTKPPLHPARPPRGRAPRAHQHPRRTRDEQRLDPWWTLWEPLPNTPYELPQFQVQTGDGLKAYIRFGGNGVEVITFVGDMMSTGEWIEGRYIELAQSQGTEPGLPAPRHSRVKLPTEHQRRMLLALSHEWRTASELAQIAGIPKKGAGTVPAGPTQPGTR